MGTMPYSHGCQGGRLVHPVFVGPAGGSPDCVARGVVGMQTRTRYEATSSTAPAKKRSQ